MVGQVGLEPTTALSTGFTVRGDANYTVLTHMAWMERFVCIFALAWDGQKLR